MFAGRVQPPSLSKVRSAMFCAAGEAQDAKQESVYGKNKWDETPLCVDELCVFMVDVPDAAATPAPPAQCWGGKLEDVRMGELGKINGTFS